MTARHQVDVWRRNLRDALDETRTHILDTIDLGPADPDSIVCDCQPGDRCDDWPKCRRAPAALRHALDQTDGNFHPTPKSPTRRGDVSNPTAAATLTWEQAVQQVTTKLIGAVTDARDIVTELGLSPIDEHGLPVDPPELRRIPMRTTTTNRTVVDTAPTHHRWSCRTITLQATAYIGAVADRLADRWHAADPTTTDTLEFRANALLRSVNRTLPRAPSTPDATDGLTECACTSGRCPHGPAGCGSVYRSRHKLCRSCRRRNPDVTQKRP